MISPSIVSQIGEEEWEAITVSGLNHLVISKRELDHSWCPNVKPLQRAPRRQWCSTHTASVIPRCGAGCLPPHCTASCMSSVFPISFSIQPPGSQGQAGYEPSPVLYWPDGDYTIYISFVFVTPSLSDRIHLSLSNFLRHFHQHTYAILTEKTPLTPQFFPYHLISLLSFKLELLCCLYSVTSPSLFLTSIHCSANSNLPLPPLLMWRGPMTSIFPNVMSSHEHSTHH